MKISNYMPPLEMERLLPLVDAGEISLEELRAKSNDALGRNMELEWVLRHENDIPRIKILEALSGFYHCRWAEYDERLPIPPEFLAKLDPDVLCASQWFPIIKDGDTVVVAASDPQDSQVFDEVKRCFSAENYEFRVALGEDIRAFIQDFLNCVPEQIIGNERTGLAYWRNTMARWRTKLACYRTDFAEARTYLSLLRWGLGLITLGRALLRIRPVESLIPLYWMMIASGICIVIIGISTYFRIKRSILRPPKHQTLVEVTAATLYFFENYQFVEKKPEKPSDKWTMLARLADMLPNSCVFIEPSLDNKTRSSLAHERNSLAAQRTVAGCYRAIYARARTGLSFIRTGVAFISIGLGLIKYFGLSVLTMLDLLLIIAGLLMVTDGAIWYWPVRKEQSEAAKSDPVPTARNR
jgi:uncharacterized membrane protein YidH (DUF202 family)